MSDPIRACIFCHWWYWYEILISFLPYFLLLSIKLSWICDVLLYSISHLLKIAEPDSVLMLLLVLEWYTQRLITMATKLITCWYFCLIHCIESNVAYDCISSAVDVCLFSCHFSLCSYINLPWFIYLIHAYNISLLVYRIYQSCIKFYGYLLIIGPFYNFFVLYSYSSFKDDVPVWVSA